MVKHLLVPLEGNEGAEAVFPMIRRLDALGLDQITLLRTEMPVAADEYAVVSDSALRQARDYLQDARDRLGDIRAPVRLLARIGPAASTILETAEEKGATLILAAVARRARLVRFLFGNVTERLVHRSTIPVLAVPPLRVDSIPDRPFRNILVPLDGKRTSIAVLAPALDLAAASGARILLLSVLSPENGSVSGFRPPDGADASREEFEDAEELLYSAGAACAEAGVDFSVILEHGDPPERILAACRDRDADAIAMATRGRSGLSRWVSPSSTLKVLRECRVPLLTVRSESRVRSAGIGTLPAVRHH
jgi:nucleotide-binding universal stress UspA family protein